jgi:hypothetical protein
MNVPSEATYRELRAETAVVFGYDPERLTPLQSTRVDLVVTMRVALDGLQQQLLAGVAVDFNKLLAASEALTKLLPALAEPERRSVAPELERARAELGRVIGCILEEEGLTEADLAERADELERLRAIVAEQSVELEELRASAAAPAPSPSPTSSPSSPSSASNVTPLRPPERHAPWAPYVNAGYDGVTHEPRGPFETWSS